MATLTCVAGYYQTLLSLNLAILGLAAGGLAGLYQLSASAASTEVARLAVRTWWTTLLGLTLLLNFACSLAGSVLLSVPHDILPGIDLRFDYWLSTPVVSLVVGATTIAAALLAIVAIASGARILRSDEIARLLLTRWSSRHAATDDARLSAVVDIARRALRDGRIRDFQSVVDQMFGTLRTPAMADREGGMLTEIADAHVLPLAEEAVRDRRFDQAATLSSVAAGLRTSTRSQQQADGLLRVSVLIADLLLDPAGRRALSSAISDVADIGATAIANGWEPTYDTACLAMGALGERIPSTFYAPDEPEVLLRNEATNEYSRDPIAVLIDGFDGLMDAAWPRDTLRARTDLLPWRDGVLRSAEALAKHIDDHYQHPRLEPRLLYVVMLLSGVIKRAAEAEDWRLLWYVTLALGQLAANADRPYFNEYPQDITGWLIEIGMRSEAKKAEIDMGVGELADIAARAVTEHLSRFTEGRVKDLVHAGQMSPVPYSARWTFVKRLGALQRDNFGYHFDPVTGADLGRER